MRSIDRVNELIDYRILEITAIHPPYIYSIAYDEELEDEYSRLFRVWNDVTYVSQFMEDNKEYLKSSVWQNANEPEEATLQVLNEARDFEDMFEVLNTNTQKGRTPDFDSLFHYLEGKYKFIHEWEPMKSYGPIRPSLLRMYAIKMGKNVYLITGGGIKLADTIQNSPDLKEHVIQNIDRVRRFLKENGITDNDDMTE